VIIRIKTRSHDTKPKQTEGKVVVRTSEVSVKPKPSGVVLQKTNNRSVLKTDELTGVILQKEKFTKILKQND
jgi:hypothetical protein